MLEFLSWLWGERLWIILVAALVVLLIFALFLNLHNASKTTGDGDRAAPPRRK
jgi:hypothetical protein